MARTLSANLIAEFGATERTPRGGLTAELWLPKWTPKLTGLTGGATEQYAHGHAVAVAVDAYTYTPGGFPSTGILDDFNRADEGPPPQGTAATGWALLNPYNYGLSVSNGQLGWVPSDFYSSANSYFNQLLQPNHEFYFSIPVRPVDNESLSAYFMGLDLLVVQYSLSVVKDDSYGDCISLYYGEESLSYGDLDFQDGDSVGIKSDGGTIEVFYKPVGGAWRKILEANSVVLDSGYVDIFARDSTVRIDDFGGGAYVPPAQPAVPVVTDIIFRARSGSAANPQDGKLYISIISGAAIETPANWDTLWADSGITGLFYPACTANSEASFGGAIAVAVWDNGGTWTGRVFYAVAASYKIYHQDYNLTTGAAIGSPVEVNSLGAGNIASMQFACCKQDEIFVLSTEQVEASQAAWQKNLYGTNIKRYTESGGTWTLDSYSFPYHTCLDGHLVKDSIDNDAASTETVAQWGKRPCGGLAVNEIDASTVAVTFGAIHWRRRGYWTHNAALRSFIYHRDSGWWEAGSEADKSDFTDGARLRLPMFARGCTAGGNNIITWSRLIEPVDFEQVNATPVVPRLREAVWARLSDNGQYFTNFERLGTQDDLTAASIIKVTHGGISKLYAVGWYAVYESDEAAAVVDTVTDPIDLALYATGYNTAINNRLNATIDADLALPSIVNDGTLYEGMLVRANFGNASEQVQVCQAFIDQLSPTLQSSETGLTEGATLTARADQKLQDTISEAQGDELAHNRIFVPPTDPIKHIAVSKGVWKVETLTWPSLYFSGTYNSLNGAPCYRLKSFTKAMTGSTLQSELYGTWFNDIAWLGLSPRVDGAIEASVRFGASVDQSTVLDFDKMVGDITYRTDMTVAKTNGVYTQVTYDVRNKDNNELQITPAPTPKESACMVGLICHAPEVGRKYSFVWERGTPLADYSHVKDTAWTENFDMADYSIGTGANRLYLIMSDYSGTSIINKAVATLALGTDLTIGKPADMRMQVLGGTIYCFYRMTATDAQIAAGTQPNWKFAFSWKTGRFGASQFGIIGRGHATTQWKMWSDLGLTPYITKLTNNVDFWSIKLSDAVIDRTMEEHLARQCWRGWTPTTFEARVDEAARTVSATAYNYADPAINPTITFKLNIPASTNEAGVFLRNVENGAPDTCVKLGIVAHSTSNSANADAYYYVVKRRFASGSEVLSAREYSPIPLKFAPGLPVPVRVSVRGSVYSVWIAGNFAGHFIDDTALGLYYGLYASANSTVFTDVYVPELYEVPLYSPQGIGQSAAEAVNQILGGRRIKAVFQYDGSIKFSYFSTHATGPSFEDTLTKSALKTNGKFFSVVRVDGAYCFAEYASAVMLAKGRKFKQVTNSDIYHYEFAYKEAQEIAKEIAERQIEDGFDAKPDLRIEPEDESSFTVARQYLAGGFLVDDVKLSFNLQNKTAAMTLGVRQLVVL